jgi:hypothetical protein
MILIKLILIIVVGLLGFTTASPIALAPQAFVSS